MEKKDERTGAKVSSAAARTASTPSPTSWPEFFWHILQQRWVLLALLLVPWGIYGFARSQGYDIFPSILDRVGLADPRSAQLKEIQERLDSLAQELVSQQQTNNKLAEGLKKEQAAIRYTIVNRNSARGCPPGWVYAGVVGWLLHKDDKKANYNLGDEWGTYNENWAITHPLLCLRLESVPGS